MLGRGSTKVARLGSVEGRRVAVLSPREPLAREPLARERQLLRTLRGVPGIVQLACDDGGASDAHFEDTGNVLTELAPFGSLRDLVDDLEFEGRLGDLTDAHVDRIIEQVDEALDELAARGYAHNDLRASNVLVFSFCARDPAATRVKLCDFGDCAPGPRDATLLLRHEIAELRCA